MSNIYNALKIEDPVQLVDAINKEINRFGVPYNDIINEIRNDPYVNERFYELAAHWIESEAKAYADGMYDDRNEDSAKKCAELANKDFVRNALKWQDDYTTVIKQAITGYDERQYMDETPLRRMHRTLKQTFSGLVFRYLDEVVINDYFLDVLQDMREKYGEQWYRCPLI